MEGWEKGSVMEGREERIKEGRMKLGGKIKDGGLGRP